MEYTPYRPFELSFVRKLALLNRIWRNVWMKPKCCLTGETMIFNGAEHERHIWLNYNDLTATSL